MSTRALVTTSFTVRSTAAEVITGIDLTGRRAVFTGGGPGIGEDADPASVRRPVAEPQGPLHILVNNAG
ncbi:hypothetical protein [Streptomyces sp. 2A115]|uniref:hypothetical protein n=1 Tax=Streptomyces sp. 2A115 TaxID=3457439 RepID=UPI003FD50DAC